MQRFARLRRIENNESTVVRCFRRECIFFNVHDEFWGGLVTESQKFEGLCF